MHDVFISYSTKDKPAADAVCATLEARGIRCWIAPRDILPGMDWSGAIIDGISESHLLVLVFSSNANDSPQIKRELERAVNKSLPIIPFRIENVPLSKPLEYFISTPHWLDALTPPMEKHLNYLADTVEVLLNRKSAEQMIPPLPPPRKDTRSLLWAAIIFAAVVIAGGAFLISRIWSDPKQQPIVANEPDGPENDPVPAERQPDGSENSQPLPAEQEPLPTTENPGQEIQSKDSIDPRLVGSWNTNPIVDGRPWMLKLRIQRNAAFDFNGTTQDSGSYVAQADRWQTRTVKGEGDSGTYTFLNPNMVTIAGRLGTAMWTRVRKRSAGATSLVDPAMVGGWQTTAVIDGKEFTFLFDVHPSGTFQISTSTIDKGRFEARNGKFRQVSKNGTIVEGTYQVLSPNTVTITGPAGPGVWTR